MRNKAQVLLNNNNIDDLTQQIALLRIQLNTLEQQLQAATETNEEIVAQPVPPVVEAPRGHCVGDRVVITNNYRNLRGVRGRIVNITRSGTWVDIVSDNGERIRCHQATLRRICDQE